MDKTGATFRIRFRKITSANVLDVCALKVGSSQQALISDNAISIAQAAVTKNAWFRAICAGDKFVGFVLVVRHPRKRACYLWRFMIDASYQGKGYGKDALNLLIRLIRHDKSTRYIYLKCRMCPGNASQFYAKLGFIEKKRVGDDAFMWLDLGTPESSSSRIKKRHGRLE